MRSTGCALGVEASVSVAWLATRPQTDSTGDKGTDSVSGVATNWRWGRIFRRCPSEPFVKW